MFLKEMSPRDASFMRTTFFVEVFISRFELLTPSSLIQITDISKSNSCPENTTKALKVFYFYYFIFDNINFIYV